MTVHQDGGLSSKIKLDRKKKNKIYRKEKPDFAPGGKFYDDGYNQYQYFCLSTFAGIDRLEKTSSVDAMQCCYGMPEFDKIFN